MDDIFSQIERLIQMKSEGHLSDAEFEAMKLGLLQAQQGQTQQLPAGPGTDIGLAAGDSLSVGKENYRLIKRLGQGGMGQVWQAEDLLESGQLKETCYKALKVLPTELNASPVHLDLLKKEAALSARLNHPNIINVFGLRESEQGIPFIIMEYLQGQNLGERLLQHGPFTWPQAQRWLQQTALGLDHAWQEQRLVHRDIKPENLFINDKQQLKILDFGIAWRIRNSQMQLSKHAVNERSVGTVSYMPPEAFARCTPSPRQDVYALACVAYQLLTLEPPYAPEAARKRDPALFPEAPEALNSKAWDALKCGLAYDKQNRPETAVAFVSGLVKAQLAKASEAKAGSRLASEPAKTFTDPYTGMEFVYIPPGVLRSGVQRL